MEFWNDGITLPNHFASAMADPTDAVCTLAHGFRRSCRRGRRSIMVMCMCEDVEKEKACGRRSIIMAFWNDGITLPSAMADPTDAMCTLAHGFRRGCRRGRRSIIVI
jgi:hypothetical protein